MEDEKMTGLGKAGREVGEEEGEEEEVVLPGFRFHPTDEELVGFYLRRKVENKPINIDIIKQIDIYKYDPWDLPKVSTVQDKEWYFFCLRGRKYRNSIRPNRVTGSGFWKATGIDRPVYYVSGENGDCIGLKKSLVYYRGSAGKGTKTDWMMHEFRLPSGGGGGGKKGGGGGIDINSIQEPETWTICRIFKRNVSYKKYAQLPAASAAAASAAADSSSKTCSVESADSGDDYKYFASNSAAHRSENNKLVVNCFDDENQLHAGQCNYPLMADQAPSTSTSYSNFPSSNSNYLSSNSNDFFFKDVVGNWDELGRIMEFAADPALYLYS